MKNKKILLLITVLTILSTLPIFLCNLPYGGDLNFHLKRIVAISENIKNGYIGYPIYFKYLNNYGYASGLFYPDLFLHIPAFLYTIGISLFGSYKVFIFIIKLASLCTIYYSTIRINKNEKSGIIAVILYAFSSYCFIDMFERGALAETLTIVFVPLVITGIYEIIYGDEKKYYILTLGMIGILYSHIISLYIITFFLLIFTIFNIRKLNKKKVYSIIKSALLFTLLGSHFLFPLIEQMITGKFRYQFQENVLIINYVPILFVFLEFPYYFFMGIIFNRWIPCGIGIIYLNLCIYFFKNRKKIDEIGKALIISGLSCLIFTTKIIWYLPISRIFKMIQFPYRIYILATVLFVIAYSRILKETKIKKIFKISFLLFLLNLCIPFINPKVKNIQKDEIMYGEYLPAEYPKLNYSSERLDEIESSCPTKYEIEYSPKIIINFTSKCKSNKLELPITYYKGYSVKLNNKNIKYYKSNNGLIKLEANEQNGTIEVFYSGTKIYNITKYIPIIGLIVLIIDKKKTKNEK